MTALRLEAKAPPTAPEIVPAAPPAEPSPPKPTSGRDRPARRLLIATLVAGAAIGVVSAGYALAPEALDTVSTDDAYVKSDVTFVSTKVPGYVTAVLTENNRRVSEGQVLVRIDPIDYRSAVADAEAAVAQARAQLGQIAAQRQLQNAQIRVAEAGVLSSRASAGRSSADFARSDALVDQGAISRQVFETAQAESVKAQAGVYASRAQADYAREQLNVLAAQRQTALAALQSAEAKLTRTQADLARTNVTSPREGRVAARNVRLGEFVNTGTRLMAITPTRGLWIEANFRETQLSRIRAGDRVDVTADAVPGVHFCGTVDGVQGASGSDFAVIPADNATGNFTKIVRRFTVRILLDQDQPTLDRLATGMSVTPRIAVGSAGGSGRNARLTSWSPGGSTRCELRS